MKKSIATVWFFLGVLALSVNAEIIRITADKSVSTYTVQIDPGTNQVEYDIFATEAPSPELCPRGIVMYIKSSAGQLLNRLDSEKGYSSSWMSSSLPLASSRFTNILVSYKFKKLPDNSVFKTGSLQISNVMFGLGPCLGEKIASISQIKLAFTTLLRVNGVESNYTAETDWLPFPDALRKSIRP